MFGFVGGDLLHVVRLFGFVGGELRHHVIFGLRLDQVAEHLHVVSARLVSFGDGEVGECPVRTLVAERYLRQDLQEVLRDMAVQSGLDRECHLHRTHLYADFHAVYRRVIIQVCLFVVQTDAGCDGEAFDKEVVIGRLVESGETMRRGVEVSGEIDLVQPVAQDGQLRRFRVVRQHVVERLLQDAA